MEQLNGMPPGLRGYMGAQQADQASQAQELGQFHTLMQLKQQMDAQKSQLQVKQILANSPDMQSAIPELMKAGPAGMQAASTLATLNEHVTKGKVAADKAAFFSPDNQKQYMQPGAVASPTTAVDDNGNPNPSVQGPGQMDMGKFLQDAAARGVINPETYANHIATQEQKKAALQQAADLRREQLSQQAELSRQRSEDMKLSQADRNQARMDAIRLAAALKPAPQERMVPVDKDGTVVYVPQSQAAGEKVGKVTQAPSAQTQKQVQQLGKALEVAKVNESHATLSQVEEIVAKSPQVLEYITGPKQKIPDAIVARMDGGKEILDARQAFAKMFNIVLKDRSGAAVTPPEYERLKEEMGRGLLRVPAQLQTALTQSRAALDKRAKAVAAGYGPEVMSAYNSNVEQLGGSPIFKTDAAAPASGFNDAGKEARYQAWKKSQK